MSSAGAVSCFVVCEHEFAGLGTVRYVTFDPVVFVVQAEKR
jgi:hypothetical protein